MKKLLFLILLFPSVSIAHPSGCPYAEESSSSLSAKQLAESTKCLREYNKKNGYNNHMESASSPEIGVPFEKQQAMLNEQAKIDELKRSNDLLEQQIQQDRDFNNRLLAEIEN